MGLAVAGFLLELVGVYFTWLDWRDVRDNVKRFRERGRNIRGAVADAVATLDATTLKASGTPPTLDQRVTGLEALVNSVRQELRAAQRDLPEQWKRDVREAEKRAIETGHDETNALAGLLLGVTEEGSERRRWGIQLLAAGIVLSSAANLLSLAAA